MSTAERSLDDLMVAMDVVDTLRHSQLMVDRELDAEGRRERLIERLRDIYQEQGIEVSDAMLEEGVLALEEDRFSYTPPKESLSVRLARIYTNRGKWGKPLLGVLTFLSVAFGGYYFGVSKPRADLIADIAPSLERNITHIAQISIDPVATEKARSLAESARLALENEEHDKAVQLQQELTGLYDNLERSYVVRVVSRPDENSGIVRAPDINERASNYYLIVEAISESGAILSLPIADEEDGQTHTVNKWGVRVDESTFRRIGTDKQDDGIIQDNIVGTKERGILAVSYSVPTTGAAITAWERW